MAVIQLDDERTARVEVILDRWGDLDQDGPSELAEPVAAMCLLEEKEAIPAA